MAHEPRKSFLRSIPVVGYVVRCFAEERLKEIALILLNFVMLGAVVVLMFGYPGLITLGLAMTLLVGLFVIASTLG